MAEHAVSRPVIVDVTSDDTVGLLNDASPTASTWCWPTRSRSPDPDAYDRLFAGAASRGRRVRYEATVGAGLPIIDTYRKLEESGDRVLRIEGCVSGTLMYVLSEVCVGRPFSKAVREAVDRGYAEPDPRDDLSGRDAARKGLILARMIGYRGAAPVAHDLVPAAYRDLPLTGVPRTAARTGRGLAPACGDRIGSWARASICRVGDPEESDGGPAGRRLVRARWAPPRGRATSSRSIRSGIASRWSSAVPAQGRMSRRQDC